MEEKTSNNSNKSAISPTKLLKMLRLRRHSLPATNKEENSGKVVADKPQMDEEQRPARPNSRPGRQRCATETIAEISDNSRKSKTLHGNFEIDGQCSFLHYKCNSKFSTGGIFQ